MKTLLLLAALTIGTAAAQTPNTYRIVGNVQCQYQGLTTSWVNIPLCSYKTIVFKGAPQWKARALCEQCSTDPTRLFQAFWIETEVVSVNVAQLSPMCYLGVNVTMLGASVSTFVPNRGLTDWGVMATLSAVATVGGIYNGAYVEYCDGMSEDDRWPPSTLPTYPCS
jgi:hypothetical protein